MRNFSIQNLNSYSISGRDYGIMEMVEFWNKEGQGHKEALERGKYCVIVKCNKYDASVLSQIFVNAYFAIPTCTHYNGNTLSLYCGDAGSSRGILKIRVEKLVLGYLC